MQMIKELTNNYSRSSTIHGFSHFGVSSVSTIRRILWFIAFISCLLMLLLNMKNLLEKFLRLELETTTNIEFGIREFPAVTVCSQNGFRRSEMLKIPAFRELLSAAQAASGHIDNARLRELAEKKFNLSGGLEGIVLQRRVQVHIEYLIRQLKEDQRITLSYEFEDIIKNCAFNVEACNPSDFASVFNAMMGRCYTYNGNKRTVKKLSRAGPNYGLKLFVYSNLSDYISITPASGAMILLHDQDEYPFPDTFGYLVPPSSAASFTIRPTRNFRINWGSSRCTDEMPEEYVYDDYAYSVEACRRTCLQHLAKQVCGCVLPRYKKIVSMEYCQFNDTIARKCLEEVEEQNFDCDCPNRCQDRQYEVDISTSPWRPESGRSLCREQNDCDELLQSGTLVSVYFENLNEGIVVEVPAYPIINLMSDTAGQFGFWIGLSFLGVIEFILFLVSLCQIVFIEFVHWYRQVTAPRLPTPDIISVHEAPPIFYFGEPILHPRYRKWINSAPMHVEERLKRHKLSSKSLNDLSKI